MSWLREDDNFDTHPKILGLGDGIPGDARRWTWNRILLYTVRHGSPLVPLNISETIPRCGRGFLKRCVDLGLLEESNGKLVVHDWEIYNGATVAEKVNYYLTRHPEATANETARAIGGMRELVLAEVKRFRSGTETGTTEPVLENRQSGTESGTHARGPVPTSPGLTSKPKTPDQEVDLDPPPTGLEDQSPSETLEELAARLEANAAPVGSEGRLLEVLTDMDANSPAVIHALLEKLPAHTIEQVRDEVLHNNPRSPVKYAVGMLRRRVEQRTGRTAPA